MLPQPKYTIEKNDAEKICAGCVGVEMCVEHAVTAQTHPFVETGEIQYLRHVAGTDRTAHRGNADGAHVVRIFGDLLAVQDDVAVPVAILVAQKRAVPYAPNAQY